MASSLEVQPSMSAMLSSAVKEVVEFWRISLSRISPILPSLKVQPIPSRKISSLARLRGSPGCGGM
jgi:hypothetical protein